jgi:hypothetical protein
VVAASLGQLCAVFDTCSLTLFCRVVLLFVDESSECVLLQGEAGVILKSPDQKTRGFLVQIVLPQSFPEHAHQVFGEMPERI